VSHINPKILKGKGWSVKGGSITLGGEKEKSKGEGKEQKGIE